MEWESPGIVLSARRYGEGDALAAVLTGEQGLHRGLAKGGLSRGKAALWQTGNLVQLRWVARLAEQLGSLSAELVHPAAALAMADARRLGVLLAACAEVETTLAERQPHPAVFEALVGLITSLSRQADPVALLVRFELVLLSSLGYGLDLACCAVSGESDGLAFVSPRTGRAVGAAHAGAWRERLLRLPGFMVPGLMEPGLEVDEGAPAALSAADAADGLALTGHFLARDAYGAQHRPLPPVRLRLVESLLRLEL